MYFVAKLKQIICTKQLKSWQWFILIWVLSLTFAFVVIYGLRLSVTLMLPAILEK